MKYKTNTHHRRFHWYRFSWFTFLIVGLLLVQSLHNLQQTGAASVLAYATNVTQHDLHSLTNQERTAHGLPHLSSNSLLIQAAQAKAEHMIANNYWAHVAPDGTTPWYFFEQAGYNYINAGENLAYGFLTSSGAVKGWMDSPGHKANILGDYKEVGFGYANGSNYQGGENTVIVAMYGTAQNQPAPIQQAAPTTSAPAPTPTPQPQSIITAETTNEDTEPTPVPTPIVQSAEKPRETKEPIAATPPAPALNVNNQESVPFISTIRLSADSWPLITSIIIIAIASVGFVHTHIVLVRRSWNLGLRYIIAHPLTDAAMVGSVLLLFISATVGHIY